MSLKDTQSAFTAGQMTKSDYIEARHQDHVRLFEYADLLPQTDIARIEITDGQVVMTTRAAGLQLICNRDDKRLVPIEILNFGAYEREDLAMVLRLLPPDACVYDVGANIGWYSLNIARGLPSAQIYAFEPVPNTFALLTQNIARNGLTNIQPFNHGFSDEEQTLEFFFYKEGSGNASSANLAERADAERVECLVKRLDDFSHVQCHPPDFIKCDVEGAELLVLRGAQETLRRARPILFVEMLRKWAAKFGYHPNAIMTLLADIGYDCFAIDGDRLRRFLVMTDETAETNFFFLDREKHAAQIAALVIS